MENGVMVFEYSNTPVLQHSITPMFHVWRESWLIRKQEEALETAEIVLGSGWA
jgi:hypothetical protein